MKQEQASLIFKDGEFLLSEYGHPYISTKKLDLKEAVKFRRFGNANTERIFKRVLCQYYDLPLIPPLPFLDPHQLQGIKWALTRSRSYLAHAPGAGKTAQAVIASILAQAPGQTVFIVPPDLTKNWEREIIKWSEPFEVWPSIGIVPPSIDKDRMAWNADFVIVSDSLLTKPWVYERLYKMKKKFLAVDEGSRFKEWDTERGVAFFGGSKRQKYPGIYRDAGHVVFLDGSPMPNRPMELWAPTYALHPESIDFMSRQDFGLRYCGATMNDRGQWEFKHSSNEEELQRKLQQNFMHVVKEEDLPHPERLRSMLFISYDVRTSEQKKWERRSLDSLKIEKLSDEKEHDNQGEIASYRKELGIRKVTWVANYVKNRLRENGESILLFAWHREVVIRLAEYLKEFHPVVIMGGVDNKAREEGRKKFQAGKRKLIIGNIAAVGRGHNLQRADRVIFAEYSWTDELNKQCEKRASRKGRDKDKPVRCEYIVAPDSMDERVLTSVFTKEKRVRKVIG